MAYAWICGEIPGTVATVRSQTKPGVEHWFAFDSTFNEGGEQMVRDSQPNDVVRRRPFSEATGGQPYTVVWRPESDEQRDLFLTRIASMEGLAWNLFVANCEQVIRWALTGEAHSQQLARGVRTVIGIGLGAIFVGAVGDLLTQERPRRSRRKSSR